MSFAMTVVLTLVLFVILGVIGNWAYRKAERDGQAPQWRRGGSFGMATQMFRDDAERKTHERD